MRYFYFLKAIDVHVTVKAYNNLCSVFSCPNVEQQNSHFCEELTVHFTCFIERTNEFLCKTILCSRFREYTFSENKDRSLLFLISNKCN